MQGQERNALVVKKKKKKWKKELLGHLRGAFCYRARNARIASRSSQLRRFEREKESSLFSFDEADCDASLFSRRV